MPGSLFVVVAPSGAGKTSLVEALLRSEPNIRLSISYTTRAPREGELQGREYHFVDRERFERMIAAGDFLAQELNREANTVASKAASQAVTEAALELKLLVEQMREQVQNIE